ncbi:lasso RiPP family leader peptide-containing protein [Stenotrophomonas sp. NPDC087984]
MKEETVLYETPALVEVGDFAELTLDRGTWGWDGINQCIFLHCI